MNVPINSARISLPTSDRIFRNFILLDFSLSEMSNSTIIEPNVKLECQTQSDRNVQNQNIEIKDYSDTRSHNKLFELKMAEKKSLYRSQLAKQYKFICRINVAQLSKMICN